MSNYEESLFVNREKKFRGFQKLLKPKTQQAVMLIEAPQDMGKTWLLGKMQHFCEQLETDIPVAQIDFRNPRQIHQIQDAVSLVRFLRDRLGHSHYFSNLNTTINSFSDDRPSDSRSLGTLRQNVEKYFNLDELRNLAFDLGINYENLPGETLRAKSRELVDYCQRHNILDDLIELCAELRGHIDWWAGMESLRQALDDAKRADVSETFIADNNAAIWADSEMERLRAEHQINSAFFECLAKLLADKKQIVLLFDSIEAASPEARRWMRNELMPHLSEGKLDRLIVIITGRRIPDLTELNIRHLLVETDLDPFTEEHVREYFEERRDIVGLDLRTIILTSGGVPGALAMMADHAMVTVDDDDDFFSDL
jgi:hypothetical protein